MNGKLSDNSKLQEHTSSHVWQIASKWLSTPCEVNTWWQLIGSHLSILSHNAGYTTEREIEVLLFLFAQVLPHVGPAPTASELPRWKSILTNDGSPFEYSWKWNTAKGSPEIRYCIEAIGRSAGAFGDPLNYFQTAQLLLQLAPFLPDLDLTWFSHFAHELGISGLKNFTPGPDGPISSLCVAIEHLEEKVMVKTYLIPPSDRTEGPASFAKFEKAARGISSNTRALDEVMKYVSNDAQGTTLTADMLAVDCIDPSKSRLKLYCGSPNTSLDSIISVMTLGGRIKNVEKGIDELRKLFCMVLGLKSDISGTAYAPVEAPFDPNLAHSFDLYGNMVYYFDIAPNSDVPDVKFYIPVARYGRSDSEVAAGLGEYLNSCGRGQFYDGYVRALEKVGEKTIGSEHRLQTFLAVAFQKDGSLAITSYMNPGIYHQVMKLANAT